MILKIKLRMIRSLKEIGLLLAALKWRYLIKRIRKQIKSKNEI